MRVGSGHDTHRLGEGRPLILGGVRVEYPRGLIGHSDADVVLHAVTDALLGAAGLGDIGDLFPDTDPQFRDMDSAVFVREALARLVAQKWRVINLDVTVFAQEPKLGPVKAAIRANLAQLLGIAEAAVSVKAKTGELVGSIGRGEAIGCQASVLIDQPAPKPWPILGGFKPGVWPWMLLLAVGVFFYLRNPHLALGHECDFITHWTLARMAVTGHGAASYDYDAQAAMIRETVPPSWAIFLETPHIIKTGGVSPYPPVMAVLYAPFGMLPPKQASLAMYYFSIGMALVTAVAVQRWSGGRVIFPAAAAAIIFYPGYLYTISLGQNGTLTLALWTLGWLAMAQGRDVQAGIMWGLLAYKPHWLFAVGWLPLMFGRYRVIGWMAATVALLSTVATLWLSPAAWVKWWTQARAMVAIYNDATFQNQFLNIAADLRAAAVRFLPDSISTGAGWAMLAAVGVLTIACYWVGRVRRGDTGFASATDRGAPALLFACGLVVPYLFYYDEVVFLLPILALWSHWPNLSWPQFIVLVVLTINFYGSPVILQDFPDAWEGPPIETIASLALWVLSLWVALTPPAPARSMPS